MFIHSNRLRGYFDFGCGYINETLNLRNYETNILKLCRLPKPDKTFLLDRTPNKPYCRSQRYLPTSVYWVQTKPSVKAVKEEEQEITSRSNQKRAEFHKRISFPVEDGFD